MIATETNRHVLAPYLTDVHYSLAFPSTSTRLGHDVGQSLSKHQVLASHQNKTE